MAKQNKKQKQSGKGALLLNLLLYVAFGMACGFFAGSFLNDTLPEEKEFWGIAYMLVCLYGGFVLHIAAHEAGHLLAGLATGYRFVSFRMGSFMLVKTGAGLRLKRFTVAGTGGQCLMQPPEENDGNFPVTLYNLGGGLTNLTLAAISLGLSFVCTSPWACAFFAIFALCGAMLGAMNLIPMGINDGANLRKLRKNATTRRYFWRQLQKNAAQTLGARLGDMPDEWFELPFGPEWSETIACNEALSCLARMEDKKDLTAAAALAERMWQARKDAPFDILSGELACELLFLRLLQGGDVAELDTKTLWQYARATRTYPSRQRLYYAWYTLHKKDDAQTLVSKDRFEKALAAYPFAGDAQNERELLALVDAAARAPQSENADLRESAAQNETTA